VAEPVAKMRISFKRQRTRDIFTELSSNHPELYQKVNARDTGLAARLIMRMARHA
jgi:hypothetical protein